MNAVAELARMLDECGASVRFGLRAQGHMPTVARLLSDGATWQQIGAVIGWDADTAREWYNREREEAP